LGSLPVVKTVFFPKSMTHMLQVLDTHVFRYVKASVKDSVLAHQLETTEEGGAERFVAPGVERITEWVCTAQADETIQRQNRKGWCHNGILRGEYPLGNHYLKDDVYAEVKERWKKAGEGESGGLVGRDAGDCRWKFRAEWVPEGEGEGPEEGGAEDYGGEGQGEIAIPVPGSKIPQDDTDTKKVLRETGRKAAKAGAKKRGRKTDRERKADAAAKASAAKASAAASAAGEKKEEDREQPEEQPGAGSEDYTSGSDQEPEAPAQVEEDPDDEDPELSLYMAEIATENARALRREARRRA
jgi:hypothetical protein